MSRWRASFTHLLICVVVALTVLSIMLFAWFPPPYFSAQGGKDLFYLIISIDIVLGPLITLIIYKHGKKGLKFDLAVIALLQLSALAYGIYSISKARPVYMVYSVDRFELINARDIDPAHLKQAKFEEFKSLPVTGPQLIAAQLPDDVQESNQIIFSIMEGGPDISALPKYYVPYNSQKQNLIKHLKPLSRIKASARQANIDVNEIIKLAGIKEDKLGYLPIDTAKEDLTAIVSRDSGEIVEIIAVDPWV